jgi:hypothetical protein
VKGQTPGTGFSLPPAAGFQPALARIEDWRMPEKAAWRLQGKIACPPKLAELRPHYTRSVRLALDPLLP